MILCLINNNAFFNEFIRTVSQVQIFESAIYISIASDRQELNEEILHFLY